MYNLTQSVLRFLISCLISFLLVVLFVHFYCPFTPANFMENFYTSYVYRYIYIFYYFISPLSWFKDNQLTLLPDKTKFILFFRLEIRPIRVIQSS